MSDNCYQTYLPNFRYKKNNIFFIFRTPQKLNIQKKIVWINETNINNFKYIDNIDYQYGNISYNLLKEENDKGLKILIYGNNNIIVDDIPQIIKYIELKLLKISLHNFEDKNIETINNKKYELENNEFTYYSRTKKNSSKTNLNDYDYDDTNW
jgi:hypothetical protein